MLVCVHLKNLHLSFPLFRFRQRHQAKSIEGIQHQHSTGTLSKPKTTQNLGWRVVGHLNSAPVPTENLEDLACVAG